MHLQNVACNHSNPQHFSQMREVMQSALPLQADDDPTEARVVLLVGIVEHLARLFVHQRDDTVK